MKILHVVQYVFEDLPGGIQKFVSELSKLQAEHGHEVVVYTSRPVFFRGKRSSNQNVHRFCAFEVLRTPVTPLMPLRFIVEDFDVVHIHAQFPLVGEIMAFLSRMRRIPIITSYHNEIELTNVNFIIKFLKSVQEKLFRKLLDWSDAVIVATRSFFRSSKILQDYRDKICVIPLGIHLSEYNFVSSDNSKKVLFVGRIKPEKGLDVLVEAMCLVRQILPEAELLIVGEAKRWDELNCLDHLLRLVRSNGLQDSVKFLGYLSPGQLKKTYAGAAVLVLPSTTRLEAFGLVQIEAMACSVPVIVSDIPGPREVSKGASLLVPPNDPKELAKAITEVLSDSNLASNMRALEANVINEYSWDKLYARYEKTYNFLSARADVVKK